GDDGAAVHISGRVDRLWDEGFRDKEANLWEPGRPVLVYHSGSEMSWLNTTARSDDQGHRRRLRTLGALLALSATNACRLPVELPDMFFQCLLSFGNEENGDPCFEPSLEEIVMMDPSLEETFKSLREAVNESGVGDGDDERREKLLGLLELEGLPSNTSPEAYMAHMVRQTFLEPIQWQMSEIRVGFLRALPKRVLCGLKNVRRGHRPRKNSIIS
ncbi:unnamed protein product, partial [Sphacelaria rigidula]